MTILAHGCAKETASCCNVKQYGIPIGAVIIYSFFIIIIDTNYSTFLCHNRIDYDEWVKPVIFIAIGGFGYSCLIQIWRLFDNWLYGNVDTAHRVICSTLVLNFLGGMSIALDFINPNVCKDSFGVITHASNWCSWLVTVPLLTYTCLVPSFGSTPTTADTISVVCNFLCILFGVMMQINDINQTASLCLFVLSSLFFLVGCYFMLVSNLSRRFPRNASTEHISKQYSDFMRAKKLKSSVALALVMLLFPMVYIAAIVKLIGPNGTRVCYLFLDVSSKGVVTFILMDSHIKSLRFTAAQANAIEVANLRKREFMKYMFHELRIPLNSIAMGLECISLRKDQQKFSFSSEVVTNETENGNNDHEERSAIVHSMKSAADYMEKALDSYLSMQQIEEGSFQLCFCMNTIADLWKSVLDCVNNKFACKGVLFELDLDLSVPKELWYDQKHLMYALVCVLGQAGRRTSEGDTIKIKCHLSEPRDDVKNKKQSYYSYSCSLNICFEDAGPMDDNLLAEARQKYQANNYDVLFTGDMLAEDGGSLVKAISGHIIKKHKGHISLQKRESSPDTKSSARGMRYAIVIDLPRASPLLTPKKQTFRSKVFKKLVSSKLIETSFSSNDLASSLSTRSVFPLNNADAVESTLGHNYVTEVSVDTTNKSIPTLGISAYDVPFVFKKLENLNVLCVDDTPSNLKMLLRLLQREGIVQTTSAVNGLEAVEIYDEFKAFDLIFMDFTMPVMNGIEATRLIRERGFKGCVVAVTGNAMDDDVKEFLDAGADAVVTKPMTINKLSQVLGCFTLPKEEEEKKEKEEEEISFDPRERLHSLSSPL